MRIVMINQFYPPDTAATGQLLADLAQSLGRRGYEVHIVCSRRSYAGGEASFKTGCSFVEGVRVWRVRASGFGRVGLFGRLADYLSFYIFAMLKVLTLPRCDVCVTLTTPPMIQLLGVLSRSLRGTSLVIWTMDLYPQIASALGALRERGWLYRVLAWLGAWSYRRAARIIALGEVMAEKLRQAGAPTERIEVVHNWVPAERVSPEPAESNDSSMLLMYSGNLGAGHDLETVLDALSKLEHPQAVRTRFVGHGRQKPALQNQAQELGLSTVEFADPVPLEQLSGHLARGDVHLISQRPGTEGLLVPSKLYGIMAAGRPALYIGPDDTEVAEILRDSGAGVCVAPGDAVDLARQIDRLAASPDVRRAMGNTAHETYSMHFGRSRSVDALCRCILSAGKDSAR